MADHAQAGTLTRLALQALTRNEEAVIAAMRVVYWLAHEEIATLKYHSLLDLFVTQGFGLLTALDVGRNAQYHHRSIAEEMQDAISASIEEDVLTLMKSSLFFWHND